MTSAIKHDYWLNYMIENLKLEFLNMRRHSKMGKIFSEKYDNTVDYSLLPESDRVFAAAEFKDTLKKT